MNYVVVVLAAGKGKRMNVGKNKQFLTLNGMPLIIRTLKAFEADTWCEGIILVGRSNELPNLKNMAAHHRIQKIAAIIPGGKERQNSVYEGIKGIKNKETLVLIHDGARPFVSIQSIHDLALKAKTCGAAVLAVPIKDTVKRIEQQKVVQTVDRSSLWAVQTPQAFRLSILLYAHQVAEETGFMGTDDASLLEAIGHEVEIVQGDYLNIKLTTPEDLLFAKAIIEGNGEG